MKHTLEFLADKIRSIFLLSDLILLAHRAFKNGIAFRAVPQLTNQNKALNSVSQSNVSCIYAPPIFRKWTEPWEIKMAAPMNNLYPRYWRVLLELAPNTRHGVEWAVENEVEIHLRFYSISHKNTVVKMATKRRKGEQEETKLSSTSAWKRAIVSGSKWQEKVSHITKFRTIYSYGRLPVVFLCVGTCKWFLSMR